MRPAIRAPRGTFAASALLGAALALAPVAHAAPDDWDDLTDALLAEAIYGDLDGSARTYERIVRNLPVEDPRRAQALFALGRARVELGHTARAREVLMEGIRTGTCLAPCQELLGRLQLDAERITTLPVRWTFESTQHGFFHPWQYTDKGSLRVQQHPERGTPVLAWHTTIELRKGDQLVVGFQRPRPVPRRVTLTVQSRTTEAWLQVVVVDDHGRTYTPVAGSASIPTHRPIQVTVDLRRTQPIDPLDPPLDRSRISQVQLRDVSALEGAPPGPNTLYIEAFGVE